MKKTKILVSVIMVALLGVSWYSFLSGAVNTNAAYEECIHNAEESFDAGLYEQAVEYYKEALTYESNEEIYLKIKDTYDSLYAEEHIAFIRNCYINDMAAAAQEYPDNELFWVVQANLYMEANSYQKAYETLRSARNRGTTGEQLEELYTDLLYMVKTGYKQYVGVKTALNGYNTVFDGSSWRVLDDYGKEITSNYNFIGLINDEGKGLYINSIDCRLLDSDEIPRARFDVLVEEAGYYNESVDLIPVKVDGIWRYMNSNGEFLPGEFEIAGSFYGSQAVACANGAWVLINADGEQTALGKFEDIKLDLYGCHIQNGIIICKENGKYHLYDTDFNMISDFEADDIDICIDPERIAFQKNGLWGFVNSEGDVVLEPEYLGAKSFANGYAAVCNEAGLWGFIDSQYKLVIDYTYLEAYFFTKAETCWVSTAEGTMQLMQFVF